jgi:hypothetical protein
VPAILYADHVEGIGTSFYKAACERDCEGVIAKHRLGPYEPVPVTWFKVLNPYYTQKRGRKELFEGFRERSTWVLDTTTGSRNDPEPPPFLVPRHQKPNSIIHVRHHSNSRKTWGNK